MATQIIKRKNAMALLRDDDAQGQPTIHSIKYRKKDGTIGRKRRVSKSTRHLPGAGKYRGKISTYHVFLLTNHDEASNSPRRTFEILIDLLVELDGMTIDHTNGEY